MPYFRLPVGYEPQYHDPTHPGWIWMQFAPHTDFEGPTARWDAPGWVAAGAFNPQVWIS